MDSAILNSRLVLIALIIILGLLTVINVLLVIRRKKMKDNFEVPDTLPPLSQIIERPVSVEMDLDTYVTRRKEVVQQQICLMEQDVATMKEKYSLLKAELDKLCQYDSSSCS